MDQYPAQVENIQPPVSGQQVAPQVESQPPSAPPPKYPSRSPFKRLIPFVIIFLVILMILGVLILLGGKSSSGGGEATPTIRPTATPLLAPTIPLTTDVPSSTISASVSPKKTKPLVFIRQGDIYQSDFNSFSILKKNDEPAGDKLSWSPKGNFLAWRPASLTATPSAITIYSRFNDSVTTFNPSNQSNAEVIDFDWFESEEYIAVLFKDSSYKISLFSSSSPSAKAKLVDQNSPIHQVAFVKNSRIYYSSDQGIVSLDTNSKKKTTVVKDKKILYMGISPNRNKVLYSTGDRQKSNLYIAGIDGSDDKILEERPKTIDMGSSNLPQSTLDNGFIPFAHFFADEKRLLVGYHYLNFLPLVGIYDLEKNSFSAIKPFSLHSSDIIIDDSKLIGARVNSASSFPSWQLSVFDLSEGKNLSLKRVIPDAYSPSYLNIYAQNN